MSSERTIDGDREIDAEELFKPFGDAWNKVRLDFEVAMMLGKSRKEIQEITDLFIFFMTRALTDRGRLYLPRLGTFKLKVYRGKAPRTEEFGTKIGRSNRRYRAGVIKSEVRFSKARALRLALKRRIGEEPSADRPEGENQ